MHGGPSGIIKMCRLLPHSVKILLFYFSASSRNILLPVRSWYHAYVKTNCSNTMSQAGRQSNLRFPMIAKRGLVHGSESKHHAESQKFPEAAVPKLFGARGR